MIIACSTFPAEIAIVRWLVQQGLMIGGVIDYTSPRRGDSRVLLTIGTPLSDTQQAELKQLAVATYGITLQAAPYRAELHVTAVFTKHSAAGG
jgi:hypothetical protein